MACLFLALNLLLASEIKIPNSKAHFGFENKEVHYAVITGGMVEGRVPKWMEEECPTCVQVRCHVCMFFGV